MSANRTTDIISILTAFAIAWAGVAPALAQSGGVATARKGAPGTPEAGAPDRACRVKDEAAFRETVAQVTLAALKQGLARVDLKAGVRQHWRELAMDELTAKRIDKAVGDVRDESGWRKLVGSLTDKEQAQRIARSVAERVYRSAPVEKAIAEIAVRVGKDVAGQMELAALDAALPAMRCVRTFLGAKYGGTIAAIVGDSTSTEFGFDPDKASAYVGNADVLLAGSGAIAGAVILLVRRQMARMASRIGRRVVGAVLGRVVAVISGGIGVVLIAKDVWELRHGVLPIVAKEMKSEATREKVQDELATTIAEQMETQLAIISKGMADKILEVWQKFQQAHTKVLNLAGENAEFRQFLNSVDRKTLPVVDRVVALVLAGEGEAGVKKRLADGTLDDAVKRLPPAALDIADDARSLDTAFAWWRLAGDEAVTKLAKFEVHRKAKPENFTEADIKTLVALDDGFAISRVVALDRADREALYALKPEKLTQIARKLTPDELRALGIYARKLSADDAKRVLQAVTSNPAKMVALAPSPVRYAILSSAHQDDALAVMLRASGPLDFWYFREDAEAVLDGRISPILLWQKHSTIVVVLALLLVLVIVLLRSLLPGFGGGRARRRRARDAKREAVG